jgi:hypothetical protein
MSTLTQNVQLIAHPALCSVHALTLQTATSTSPADHHDRGGSQDQPLIGKGRSVMTPARRGRRAPGHSHTHEHQLRRAQDGGKRVKAGHRPTGRKTSRAGLTLSAATHRESLPTPSEADHPRLAEAPELEDRRAAAVRACRAITRANRRLAPYIETQPPSFS